MVVIYLITAGQGSLARARYCVTASDILYRHKIWTSERLMASSRSQTKDSGPEFLPSLILPAIISLVVESPYEFYTFTDTFICWFTKSRLPALILQTSSSIFKKCWGAGEEVVSLSENKHNKNVFLNRPFLKHLCLPRICQVSVNAHWTFNKTWNASTGFQGF